ncbi:type I polyketide synthase [Streptomyces sp. NBC_00083]|uniref:type I polyketide synthase n=1 Tax=Streptomyces sp. NBC_00083 TaxID=2975647 RepID=UPI0022558F82|nr:beta-ketoacyl synthase N-terminal-like domain-containing protein [Streptomyces sp. NBC_00083]MCX5388022.1 acyltransferase domain-containing protein [Streptomyces sp. NBC_00083]
MDQPEVASDRSIAVIGLGCRFPGAANADEFWERLIGKADSVTAIPGDRYDAAAYHAPDGATPGKSVSARGGFIDDPFAFDPAFFGISPAEARTIDPQHRVLLQVVWEALEDAGVRPSALAGSRTGVFVGQATSEYGDEHRPLTEQDIRRTIGSQLRSMAAGRISYALDLRGPSVVLDTACSSSLVAVHMARQSLLTGESDFAVVGGANVVLAPRDSIAYSQADMLSPEGRCAFGDADARGFVRSDGVGVVLLKRLADARRDGDQVLAVLAGSAVNNDGRSSGLLVKPSVPGQADMLRDACRSSGISPADLSYVEAHGTGTSVGDAVELAALARALGSDRAPDRPLRIGSVKSNIGHAEAAAGIAGLIKTVLIARTGVIPASLHVNRPNPLLEDPRSPLHVVTENEPLEERDETYLGVSSFGLSGTNAHVVVARHPRDSTTATTPDTADGRPHLLVISARSEQSLDRLATAYARHLRPGGAGHHEPLSEICAAAALRRDHHPYRMWVIGHSREEIAGRLDALAAGEEITDGGRGEAGFGPRRQTVFVFPGQGAQWPGMGRGLLRAFPAFRERMAECDAAIRRELGWSVVELLESAHEEFPGEIDVVQPALWAMEVSLAALWADLGVDPSACVGHSMGETAAAVVAGALSVPDAAAVICRRSRLMRRLGGRGRMLATDLSPDEAERIAERSSGALCVAVENSPRSTVLAGDPGHLAALAEDLTERGRLARFVNVSVASHSPDMDPLRPGLLAALTGLAPRATSLPLHSTVRAEPVPGTALTAAYWMDNLRRPVRFAGAVEQLAKEEESVFLEISPHPLLTSAVEETLDAIGAPYLTVASLHRKEDEAAELARAAGRLHASGAVVDFARWFRRGARPVPLPRYPWDNEHLREAPPQPQPTGYTYERPLGAEALGISFRGTAVVPPMLYVDAVLSAARSELGGHHRIEDIRLSGGLVDRAQAHGASLRITLRPEGADHLATVQLVAPGPAGAPARTCLTARVTSSPRTGGGTGESLDALLAHCTAYLAGPDFYDEIRGYGYEVPGDLAGVCRLWRRDGRAVARMRLSAPGHPAAWEILLQPLLAVLPRTGPDGASYTYLPVGVDSLTAHGDYTDLTKPVWSSAVLHPVPHDGSAPWDSVVRADVVIHSDDGGHVLAELHGVQLLRLTGQAGAEEARPAAPERDSAAPEPAPPAPEPASRPAPGPADGAEPAADGETVVLTHAAALLGMKPERIDRRRPLRELGLDSIAAVKLRQRIRTALGIDLPVGRLLGRESIGQLVASTEM